MTYNENIERLKQASNYNTSLANRYETEHANQVGSQGIRDAQNIASGLKEFSSTLKEWQEKQKEKALEEGKLQAQQYATADAAKLVELQQELKTVKEQDTRYHEIKAEMLKLSGPDVYPEADRLAKLSPWAQVGYAQEKLRVFNESFDDKLAYMMQNSDQAITIQGFTFTPRELRENNITGLPFKEAAVQLMAEQLKQESGIYNFSPELLTLAGTNEAIQKAKDGQMEKFRERYNIDASGQTRAQAVAEWQRSEKTGSDLHRLFLQQAATVDDKNQVLGNAGAWASVMDQLTTEGIALGDPGYADVIGNLPIPAEMAAQIGAKPGTTFKQQWPQRFNTLKSKIKKGYVTATNAELSWLENAGTETTNKFIKEARENPEGLTSDKVNEYKREYGRLGLTIPSKVSDYETASDRNEREDKDLIESLMASQNGYISNEQLDAFHPKAALEFREKATKMEKAALKEFDAEKKIKAHLDTAFTNMGIKTNEKSPAYVEAMANAKADYAVQYNRYVAMGYSASDASHLALRGQPGEAKDPDGNPIPGAMGVLTEIEKNGENSKYVVAGQSVERTLKPGHIRVSQIKHAKDEILNDANVVTKTVIGGDYGHRQITTIKNNIEKYGSQGLYMDKGALAYYQGIARGRNPREGGWWGLVDAQLKAAGHEGLNKDHVPIGVQVATGTDDKGNKLPDPLGLEIQRRKMSRAMQYPSVYNNRYIMNTAKDGYNNTGTSVWDRLENLRFGPEQNETTYEQYLELERKGWWPRDKTPPKPPPLDPLDPRYIPVFGGERR